MHEFWYMYKVLKLKVQKILFFNLKNWGDIEGKIVGKKSFEKITLKVKLQQKKNISLFLEKAIKEFSYSFFPAKNC